MKASREIAIVERKVAEGSIVQKEEIWSIPKTEWGHGPWQNEPDDYVFEYKGLQCQLWRNHGGAWSAYVYLPEAHPWIGLPIDQILAIVHGGVTFSGTGKDSKPCVGFDCLHAFDIAPLYRAHSKNEALLGSAYRDFAYVLRETMRLAEQVLFWNG